MIKLIKAEKRQLKKDKAKKAPQGATLSGQINKMKTSKNYAGKKRKK